MADYGHGDLKWFQHDRFGMFIHWGLYAMPARNEWIRDIESIKVEDYQIYFDLFNPDLFCPKEWAKAAREAGMKYFVITAKHHEGFCLWDTKYTDYKVTNTPIGRDLLKEVIEAFRAEGLHIGIYYSLLDWHHPDYIIDDLIGPYKKLSAAERQKMNQGRDMKRYAEYMRNQVTELLTNYGKIDVLWFDFSYPCKDDPDNAERGKSHLHWESEKLIKLVRSLQSDIIVDNRLDLPGAGDIATPEQFTPATEVTENGKPVAWEGCQTFSGSWGYFRDESSWKSPEQCITMLVNHVSRNGNLLMNVGPTSRGYLDHRALACLNEYGKWMKYNSRSIYGCGLAPNLPEVADCRYTYNAETKRLYLHIFAWPFKTVTLPKLAGKVKYMQLLEDGSELKYTEATTDAVGGNSLNDSTPAGAITVHLPVHKPQSVVPVVEIFLNQAL